MSSRCVATVFVVATVASIVPFPAVGQPVSGWTLPRTADGQPDLQGAWSFATITPLERPSEYAGRKVLTDEEVAARNEDSATRASSERRGKLTAQRDVDLAYDQFWWDRGTSDGRTSLIVDPPDGRIPFTPEGRQRIAARRTLRNRPAMVRKIAVLGSGASTTRKRARRCQRAATTIIFGSFRRETTS